MDNSQQTTDNSLVAVTTADLSLAATMVASRAAARLPTRERAAVVRRQSIPTPAPEVGEEERIRMIPIIRKTDNLKEIKGDKGRYVAFSDGDRGRYQ